MTRSRVTFATIDAAAIAALFVSPSTTARVLGAQWAEPEAVHEAGLRGRREVGEHRPEAPEIRVVEPVAVDVAARDHAHADAGRAAHDGAEELLALGRRDLLRVVQVGERPDAVVAQALVVEQDTGDDERPGERASSSLVRAGDEARAEPAVEREELLAGAARHRDEDSAGVSRP